MKAALLAGALLVTAGLGAGLVLRPGDRQLALHAWLLAIGGLGLLGLVRATGRSFPAAGPSPLDAPPRARPAPPRVLPELDRLERELSLSTATAFDVHYRLRPLLREIAAHRLRTRRGLDLDGGSPEVVALLGPAGWKICDPGRGRPADHSAPGPTLAQLRDTIDALEAL